MSNRPPYIPPAYYKDGFNCPYCGMYAQQEWSDERDKMPISEPYTRFLSGPVKMAVCKCLNCEKSCLWLDGKLTVPNYHGMPPNDDMSDDIKKVYKEARDISQKSPRAAAALLRLALQMLCKQLGGAGAKIHSDIQSFIDEGKLSDEVIDSMDAVRLTGNHAVHPGKIDFNDNSDVVNILFELINFIAEEALTKPRERAERLAKINALTGKTTKQED